MPIPPEPSPTFVLAVRVAFLALVVGSIVAGFAMTSSAGACGPPLGAGGASAPDATCLSLVRTLSQRIGVGGGVGTAVIVLTMVGLSRTAPRRRSPIEFPAASSPSETPVL